MRQPVRPATCLGILCRASAKLEEKDRLAAPIARLPNGSKGDLLEPGFSMPNTMTTLCIEGLRLVATHP